jgi:hypothetical protein
MWHMQFSELSFSFQQNHREPWRIYPLLVNIFNNISHGLNGALASTTIHLVITVKSATAIASVALKITARRDKARARGRLLQVLPVKRPQEVLCPTYAMWHCAVVLKDHISPQICRFLSANSLKQSSQRVASICFVPRQTTLSASHSLEFFWLSEEFGVSTAFQLVLFWGSGGTFMSRRPLLWTVRVVSFFFNGFRT